MGTLGDALNKALRAEQDAQAKEHDRDRTPGEYWRPSQLGYCDRRNVLEHFGVEKLPLDAQTLRTFWMGNQVHAALQKRIPFELIGHELEFEGQVGEAKIHGRLDTYAMNDGLREVIEFKSVKGSSWRYGGRPSQNHILQIGCYLKWPILCPKRETPMLFCPVCGGQREHVTLPEPQRGRLVYWNKDDGDLEEYTIEFTEELNNAIEAEIDRLEDAYQTYKATKRLPPELPPSTPLNRWSREHCPYRGRGCCAD